MLFIIVLALIVVGPRQIPTLARQLGRLMNEIKRSMEAVTKPWEAPVQKWKHENKDITEFNLKSPPENKNNG